VLIFRRSVRCSETVTKMALLNANEDFVTRSLGALGNVWERLAYVAGLRNSGGRYEHWGMSQTYGRNTAQKAMAEAHSELFQQTLSTPLRDLQEPFSRAIRPAAKENYVPEDTKGCCPEHMEYVVEALTALSLQAAQNVPQAA
jgi:hypothetical protein